MRQTTRWSTLLCRYQTGPESPSASKSFALCLLPHGVTLKSPIHVSLKPPRRCVQLDRSSIHRHGHRRHLHSPVHQFPITDYTFSKTSHAVYEGINKITTGSNHDSFNGGVARVNHTRLRLLRWWSKNSKRLADSTSRIGLPQLRQRRDKACPQPSPHGPPSISTTHGLRALQHWRKSELGPGSTGLMRPCHRPSTTRLPHRPRALRP